MSPLLKEANNRLNNQTKPTWGDLRITIPVMLASGSVLGYAFVGFFIGA